MQIVIEVPEQVYNEQNFANYFGAWSTTLQDTLMNGIVLPSGHGRLIDADSIDLQRELFSFVRYTGIDEFPYEDATKATFDAPTLVPPHKEVIKRG